MDGGWRQFGKVHQEAGVGAEIREEQMLELGDPEINENLKVKSETIYHYTSFSVLPEFFKDGADLYCTNSKCLNDPTEMTYGANGFAEYLHSKGLLPDDRRLLLLQNIRETVQQDWFDAWIMSLSMLGDDLSQWRGYTSQADGGYAIGFDTKKLVSALKKLTPSGKEASRARAIPLMARCWYYRRDWPLIRMIYEQKYKSFKSDFDAYASAEKLSTEIIRPVISSVFTFSMHIKHDAFKAEEEARIILFVPGTDYSLVRILGGKPRLPLQLPMLGEPLHTYINEIRISPHGQRDRLHAQVEWLKRKCGGAFKVFESDIPYDPSR